MVANGHLSLKYHLIRAVTDSLSASNIGAMPQIKSSQPAIGTVQGEVQMCNKCKCNKCECEKPLISMDKQYQTRDGRKVTLYCVDAPGDYPVHGRIERMQDAKSWDKYGKCWVDRHDLGEVPKTHHVDGWLYVFADG